MSQSTEKSLGQVAYETRVALQSYHPIGAAMSWDKLTQAARAGVEAEAQAVAAVVREQCAQACEAERAEFLEQSAMNNSRQSDMAFGSVCSSERIAAAIRSMKL